MVTDANAAQSLIEANKKKDRRRDDIFLVERPEGTK
jgi:hypothetical protein